MPNKREFIAGVDVARSAATVTASIPLTDADEQYPLQPSALDPTIYSDPVQFERKPLHENDV